ncbi:MAG TPA: fused MFS/spermidine synthase [Sphingomonadaceae bacterium]|nr:fused MFS/spermidine synthase [Sphingomonadaceae bacterium]
MTHVRVAGRQRIVFLATLLTGSFLLFLIQPMIARMALPRLGGAPAVWNSAMLVYQALLLGGYAYAHAIGRLQPRVQAMVHMSLLAVACLWLPVGLSAAVPDAGDAPLFWVPWLLVSSIGPLFFVVAAQAPLMQRWYGLTSNADPYPLYAASNLGSFAGLLSYPLLVEPGLDLSGQSWLWSALYVALVILVGGCGLMLPRGRTSAEPQDAAPADPVPARRYAYWIALAAVPSGLMLSTTTHLTTDIVAVPLLWVLPLGLYLLSFTVAFAVRRTAAEIIGLTAPLLILSIGGLAFTNLSSHPAIFALAGLVLLFVVAVTLHAEMYRTRPGADKLTGFYLAMSVGGVLGGVFCALVAPAIFDWIYEHPLLILAAAALVPQNALFGWLQRLWSGPSRQPATAVVVALLLALAALASGIVETGVEWLPRAALVAISVLAVISVGRRLPYMLSLLALMSGLGAWSVLSEGKTRTRSYFGVYGVETRAGGRTRVLMHGTTIHGMQMTDPARARTPTTYYAPRSGVGLPLVHADALFNPGASVAVVGLGTGTLSCYKRPEQDWTFFEIDPAMVGIARDSGAFTFLRRCAPNARIVVGDARLTLAAEPDGRFDMVALDAFSSDAVPLHLLTAEAFSIYARALKPGGLLMVHISNRYLNLQPVLSAVARRQGWALALRDHEPSEAERTDRATRSVWVAMSKDPEMISRLRRVSEGAWMPVQARPGFAPWTDDYATILPLMKLAR